MQSSTDNDSYNLSWLVFKKIEQILESCECSLDIIVVYSIPHISIQTSDEAFYGFICEVTFYGYGYDLSSISNTLKNMWILKDNLDIVVKIDNNRHMCLHTVWK